MPRTPAMYEIRYEPQGRVEWFYGSRGNYYEFEDGSRLDVHTIPAWCGACGGLTHGQRIDSPAQIDQQVADLNDPSSELYRFTQRSLLPGWTTWSPRTSSASTNSPKHRSAAPGAIRDFFRRRGGDEATDDDEEE